MKNEIKMLYKKDAKLAKQVAAALGFKITAKTKTVAKDKLTKTEKKVAQGLIQYLKAANNFKKGALNLMIKSRQFGADTKVLKNLTDKLIESLEAQEADKWGE